MFLQNTNTLAGIGEKKAGHEVFPFSKIQDPSVQSELKLEEYGSLVDQKRLVRH